MIRNGFIQTRSSKKPLIRSKITAKMLEPQLFDLSHFRIFTFYDEEILYYKLFSYKRVFFCCEKKNWYRPDLCRMVWKNILEWGRTQRITNLLLWQSLLNLNGQKIKLLPNPRNVLDTRSVHRVIHNRIAAICISSNFPYGIPLKFCRINTFLCQHCSNNLTRNHNWVQQNRVKWCERMTTFMGKKFNYSFRDFKVST